MSVPAKGWCPTVFAPMPTGDGLLARIKPPLGQLSAEAARAVANAARAFGSGRLELTNRGAIQVRGLTQSTLAAFSDAIVGAGLASANPAAEQRRNVTLTSFAAPRVTTVAAALERWLEDDTELAALPAKFSFAIDCAQSPAPPLAADVRCVAEDKGWRIELDGASSATLTTEPVPAIAALTRSFLALTATTGRPPRMRELVARLEAQAIWAHAGLTPTVAPPQQRIAVRASAGWTDDATRGFGLGAPFGALDAQALATAADLADRHASGWLRMTPSRALLLVDVTASEAAKLASAAGAAGFIVSPDDPRLAITACVGHPGCASAFTQTRADAAQLAALSPTWLHDGVHVSGCSKGCAHPAAAAIALVGSAGGYDLILAGRAGDVPAQRGLQLGQAVQFLNQEHP